MPRIAPLIASVLAIQEAIVGDYKKLDVWKLACEFADRVDLLILHLPSNNLGRQRMPYTRTLPRDVASIATRNS